MAPPASTFLTAGFVAFPLLLCAALMLGSDWAGRRLAESTRARVHWAIGVSAGLLGLALARGPVPRWLVTAWNLGGLALLVNIVTVAILSTPLFRWFGDDKLNTWVTYPPFVWLPAVMVTAALIGHLLVFRWLASTAGA